jgi:O-antigen chain-terminating methyltransferase
MNRGRREPYQGAHSFKIGATDGLIDSAAPGVDIDELVARVRQRVSALRERPHGPVPLDAFSLRSSVFIDSLEANTNIADQKLQIRTQWPSNIGTAFPFAFEGVRRRCLSGLAFLFKDQRHVNAALVAAFREQISLNRQLVEQLRALREDLEMLGEALHVEETGAERER